MARLSIKDATEVAARANRPVHGIRVDAQDILDLFHKLKGIAGLAVELVHKGEDGNVAQGANAKQLDGLSLDALGGVDHHDGGVGSHKRTVGILGEVLVARGVKDVHAATVVGKLQHRRGDGDTALLFDVHPVGYGMLRARLALNGTRRLDAAGIEQQFFGKGRLAGVGVRNDRKRATRGNLVRQGCHACPNWYWYA